MTNAPSGHLPKCATRGTIHGPYDGPDMARLGFSEPPSGVPAPVLGVKPAPKHNAPKMDMSLALKPTFAPEI